MGLLQIYQEIAKLPYLLNLFSFNSGSECEKFAGRLSCAQFKHIRKIRVQLTGYDMPCVLDLMHCGIAYYYYGTFGTTTFCF
jgi:hypothetical protein